MMKIILLYLFMVGIPILGILGLLQVGQSLSAPVSLAGTWSAQLNPPPPRVSSSGNLLLHSGPTVLSISQSGPHLLLSFDDDRRTSLVGSVHDMTIDAGLLANEAMATAYASNFGTPAIYFHARVDRQTDPNRLLGILIFDDGTLRTEVPLTAIRQNGVRKATGGQ